MFWNNNRTTWTRMTRWDLSLLARARLRSNGRRRCCIVIHVRELGSSMNYRRCSHWTCRWSLLNMMRLRIVLRVDLDGVYRASCDHADHATLLIHNARMYTNTFSS